MNIINNKLLEIYNDLVILTKIVPSIDVIQQLRFDGNLPDYEEPILQQIYLLRYLYGYHFEYNYIFKHLLELLNFNILSTTRILSIGCGAAFDYLSLRQACDYSADEFSQDPCIDYIGVDKANWMYTFCADKDDLVKLHQRDLIEWINENPYDFSSRDIIIFPKSIGEFSPEYFEKLLDAVSCPTCHNSLKRVAILWSFRKTHHDEDANRLIKFAVRYKEINNFNTIKIHDINIKKYDSRNINTYKNYKSYPSEIKVNLINISNLCNKYINNNNMHCEYAPCIAALANKSPITTDKYVDFQIEIIRR